MTKPSGKPKSFGERRTAPRSRVLFGGKACFRDGSMVYDCIIRDLSTKGARITLPQDAYVPSHIILVDRHNLVAYEASVMWIRVPEFGLRFDRMHGPGAVLPPGLEFVADLMR